MAYRKNAVIIKRVLKYVAIKCRKYMEKWVSLASRIQNVLSPPGTVRAVDGDHKALSFSRKRSQSASVIRIAYIFSSFKDAFGSLALNVCLTDLFHILCILYVLREY